MNVMRSTHFRYFYYHRDNYLQVHFAPLRLARPFSCLDILYLTRKLKPTHDTQHEIFRARIYTRRRRLGRHPQDQGRGSCLGRRDIGKLGHYVSKSWICAQHTCTSFFQEKGNTERLDANRLHTFNTELNFLLLFRFYRFSLRGFTTTKHSSTPRRGPTDFSKLPNRPSSTAMRLRLPSVFTINTWILRKGTASTLAGHQKMKCFSWKIFQMS